MPSHAMLTIKTLTCPRLFIAYDSSRLRFTALSLTLPLFFLLYLSFPSHLIPRIVNPINTLRLQASVTFEPAFNRGHEYARRHGAYTPQLRAGEFRTARVLPNSLPTTAICYKNNYLLSLTPNGGKQQLFYLFALHVRSDQRSMLS